MPRSFPRLALLLLGCICLNALAIWLKPAQAVALDMRYWEEVVAAIRAGLNPYHSTTRLNWPPLWYWILTLLSWVQGWSGLALQLLVQLFLLSIELVLIVALYRLVSALSTPEIAFKLALWGIVLNPICLALNVQHLNFDVVVALFCLLAVAYTLRWNRAQRPRDWLAAAFFVGAGILAKSVPVVLIPLLCVKLRRLSTRQKLYGAALVFAPTALGLGYFFTLYPQDILTKVIQYRSVGWGLVPGLLHLVGIQVSDALWSNVFFVLLLAALCLACGVLRRDACEESLIIRVALLVLLLPATLGPGFANQYLWWPLPLCLLLLACGTSTEKKVVLAAYICALPALGFDYLYTSEHGTLLPKLGLLSPFSASTLDPFWLRVPLALTLIALCLQLASKIKAQAVS